MADKQQVQLSFGGGVNAAAPAHLIGADQVQTATNVDFSLEPGAIRTRRGVAASISTLYQHYTLFRANGPSSGPDVVFSSHKDIGAGTFGIGRGTVGGAYAQIISGNGEQLCGFGKYQGKTFIAGAGTSTANLCYAVCADGTSTANQWILPAPAAPTITVNTSTTLTLGNGTYTVTVGTAGTLVGTATATADATTGNITVAVSGIGSPTNLTTNADGSVFGSFGQCQVDMMFSSPTNVYSIEFDFSVGDSSFTNYFSSVFYPNSGSNILSALVDPSTLVAGQQFAGTTTTTGLTAGQIAALQNQITQNLSTPTTGYPTSPNVFGKIVLPQAQFNFNGQYTAATGSNPWSQVYAVRFVVNNYSASPSQVIQVRNPQITGDGVHPLNDVFQGYTWWDTYACVDANGNITESAPSTPSTTVQAANFNAKIVSNLGTANLNGPLPSGVTHIFHYRQGGLAPVPYAVGTTVFGTPYTATTTFTDSMSDINALSLNEPMTLDVFQVSPGTNVDFPTNCTIMSAESWYDRLWLAVNSGTLAWSMPGAPQTFPKTSVAEVCQFGDNIQAIIPWTTTLVIVTRDKVYEMQGSVFEGPNTDFVIQVSAARRGSIAPRSAIKTPYGIPLLHSDGLYMYKPGYGVDESLSWVTEAIGNAFRGINATDPAALDGSRVPAINANNNNASAVFNEDKLYLAVPTGASSTNNTIFVIDFAKHKVWNYDTGGALGMDALCWDFETIGLLGAAFSGIYVLETGTADLTLSTWTARTRAWTVPTDTIVENLAIEYAGGPFVATAIFDGTTTNTLGTFGSAGAVKQYAIPNLSGQLTNNLVFGLAGTTGNHTSVYGLTFDAIPQPMRVSYWREDYFDNNYPGDKLWDYLSCEIGMLGTNPLTGSSVLGTVTAVTYVDGTVVMTNTIIGTAAASGNANLYTFSFPAESFGGVVFTTYTAAGTASNFFKFWGSKYGARNDPPKVNYWKSDTVSLDENIVDGYTVDIFPNGTVTATTYIDGTAIATSTIPATGTSGGNPQRRQSYIRNVSNEQYGRTIFNEYTGTAFKIYETKFHLRKEPDRYTNFTSPRQTFPTERHFHSWSTEINPLGNVVTAQIYVDGAIVSLSTFTGTLRDRFVSSIPAEVYGRTSWISYTSVGTSNIPGGISASGGTAGAVAGSFKWYGNEDFQSTPEPEKLSFVQVVLPPYPSGHYLKTLISTVNPLGTCTAQILIDGAQLAVTTFTGTIRQTFNYGLDLTATQALTTCTAVEVRYTAGGVMKVYDTQIESDPLPFHKTSWSFSFKKLGASQIDKARYWAFDVEPAFPFGITGTATVTTVWDLDTEQIGFTTNTFFVSTRTYIDRIPFPAGGRARLWQMRVTSSVPIRVWRANLQEEQVGVKGLSVKTFDGSPQESSYSVYKYSG